MTNLYSTRGNERRKQFNNIINGIDMVLINNIPQVDASVWDNWEDASPMSEECEIEESTEQDMFKYNCQTHSIGTNEKYQCNEYQNTEIYQWFAVGANDADFLKQHGQYVTYSDMLDTYFLAICHFGTSWDYVESMVSAFNDLYHGLDELDDSKEA